MLNVPQRRSGLRDVRLRRSRQESAGGSIAQEVAVERKTDLRELTRRERQIMEIVYRLGKATAIDVMANLLKKYDPDMALASTNVGSLGGLLALRKGNAHLAGSHLLDTETGDYNTSYIRRYLPGLEELAVPHVQRARHGVHPPFRELHQQLGEHRALRKGPELPLVPDVGEVHGGRVAVATFSGWT
jgi:hypothetical protein